MRITTSIGILVFFVAASVQGQMMPPDQEVESLWQDFQAVEGDPGSAEELRDLMQAAMRLQARAEHGERSLSGRDWQRLQSILNHRPEPSAQASRQDQDSELMTSRPAGLTGEISGVVREASTGNPLTQGSVRAIPFGGDASGGTQQVGIGSTGGFYEMTLETGHWVLQTSGTPEHVVTAWPDIECVNANVCDSWYGGRVFEVNDGDTLTRDIEVERGVRITGMVDDAAGNPVTAAKVVLLARNGQVRASTETNSSGSYTTSQALPPGDYRVYVEAPSGSGLIGQLHDGQECQSECEHLPVGYEALSDTSAPVTYDFTLNDGFRLSGQVTESDGFTELEGARVTLLSTDGLTSVTAETGQIGDYVTGPLRATDYVIIVRHDRRLGVVHPGVECFDNDCVPEVGTPVSLGGSDETLDFSLSEGATVSGQVLRESDGTEVAGAGVTVGNSLQGSRFATTNSAGDFTVEGLAEGTHYVTVRPDNATDPELQKAYLGDVNCAANHCGDFGEPLAVADSATVGPLTIRLAEGGGISGSVTDEVTGVPLPYFMGTRLELWVASGPFAGELAVQEPPDFPGGGDYVVDGLKPGAYKATFATSSHLGIIDTAFGGQACPRGSCDLDELPTVFVTAGGMVSGIDAALPRGPVISGQVLDAVTSEPRPPSPSVFGISRSIIAFYGTSGNYASFSTVDGEGKYRSRTGFPADSFFAATYTTRNDIPYGDNLIDQVYDGLDCPRLKCNLTASGTAINVAGSDIGNIDFHLREGGGISGAVTDVDSGDLLAGIGLEVYDDDGRRVADAVTDALGNYTVDALPTGSYTIRTRNSRGYQDQLHDSIACTPFCNPVSGTTVSVTEGSIVSGIDFELVQSVAISGLVTVDGMSAENISVRAYGAIGNFIAETMSASDGSFAFTSLPPGEFYLRTRNSFGHADTLYQDQSCVGDACRVRWGDRIILDPGEEQTGVNLDLTSGAVISGEVNDRTDTTVKLSGVTVQLLNDRGAVAFEQTADSSGQYSFDSLAAGDYHLVTRQTPGYVDQTLGGNPCSSACNGLGGTGVNITAGDTSGGHEMSLTPGTSISGSVGTAGGSPVVGAQAQVYNDSGVPVSREPTNASGNYEFNNLPDGDFFVRVTDVAGHVSELWDNIACSGFCDILSGDPVSVSSTSPAGSINFTLSQGGAIAGVVTSSGGSALPGVEVVAFDSAGFIAGRAVTNASGQYTVQGLVNGDYHLRTTNVGGFIDEVYGGDSCSPGSCVVGDGTAVTVSGATVNNIDFSLDSGTSIAGTATDFFGNPLPDGTAVLLDADGFEITTGAINDGLWSFDGLADGTYYLLIENNLGLVDELYDDVSCPAGSCDITGLGTPIVIGSGAGTLANSRGGGVADIAVVLGEGSAVSGKVTDADTGEPLVDVVVYFFDETGQLVASSDPTDGLGEYESGGGVPEGTYFAATASGSERGADGNYINELYDNEVCMLDCDATEGTAIEVGASEVTGIDFALSQGAGVRGHVTGPNDEDLVQVEVRLYDGDGFLAGVAKTNSQGLYEIDGLAAGDYFGHTVNDQDLTDVTFGDAVCVGECDPLDGDAITVGSSGFTENIDFQLELADEVFTDRFEE